jgi:hypothetical protein
VECWKRGTSDGSTADDSSYVNGMELVVDGGTTVI